MDHAYKALESDPLWRVVESALDQLVQNADVVEQTPREYIVGYIVKTIRDSGEPRG